MLLIPLASACAEAFAPLSVLPAPTVRCGFAIATFLLASIEFWAGITTGIITAIAALAVARNRIRAARREAAYAKATAARLDYERDLAQQALVQKLEQERELSKEKIQ